jgi:STAM-binding protein
MSSPYANVPRPSPRPSPSNRRPLTIAELSERALSNLWDPSKGLKQWLKKADGFRKAGRAYAEAGELEEAFMEYAKSATIILEKLPMHKEYYTLLSPTQRHNLGLVSNSCPLRFSFLPIMKCVLCQSTTHFSSIHCKIDLGVTLSDRPFRTANKFLLILVKSNQSSSTAMNNG